MSSTKSTAHRGYFCRALYLPRSNDKLGQDVSVVLSLAFFCRALHLRPSKHKWEGALILARVPKDLRDPRVLRDTKVSAQY